MPRAQRTVSGAPGSRARTRGPLAAATAAPPADISLRGGGGPASLLGGDRERCGHRAALHRARRRSRRMAARGLASDRSSSPQVPALRTASPVGSASGTAAGLPRPQRAPSPGRGEETPRPPPPRVWRVRGWARPRGAKDARPGRRAAVLKPAARHSRASVSPGPQPRPRPIRSDVPSGTGSLDPARAVCCQFLLQVEMDAAEVLKCRGGPQDMGPA